MLRVALFLVDEHVTKKDSITGWACDNFGRVLKTREENLV